MYPNNTVIKDHILCDKETCISKTVVSIEWHSGETIVLVKWELNKVTGKDSTVKSYVIDKTQKKIYLDMLRKIV